MKYLREAGARAAARSANREAVDFLGTCTRSGQRAPKNERGAVRRPGHPHRAGATAHRRSRPHCSSRGGELSAGVGARRAAWRCLAAVSRPDGPLVRPLHERRLRAGRRSGRAPAGCRETSGGRGPSHRSASCARPTLVSMGEPAQALPHMERGIALYDPASTLPSSTSTAATILECVAAAISASPGGCSDIHQALATLHDAVRLAESVKHHLSTVMSLWFTADIQYERGECAAAAQTAGRMMALIDAPGYAAWRDDLAPLFHEARGDRLSIEELRGLERRLAETQTSRWRRVVAERVLATMYAESGRPDEGLRVLNAQRGDTGFSAPQNPSAQGRAHPPDRGDGDGSGRALFPGRHRGCSSSQAEITGATGRDGPLSPQAHAR